MLKVQIDASAGASRGSRAKTRGLDATNMVEVKGNLQYHVK